LLRFLPKPTAGVVLWLSFASHWISSLMSPKFQYVGRKKNNASSNIGHSCNYIFTLKEQTLFLAQSVTNERLAIW
jgi:hypothetical protein